MSSEAKKEFMSLLSQITTYNEGVVNRKQKLLESHLTLTKELDALLKKFINGTDIILSKEEQKETEVNTFLPTNTILVLNDKSIEFCVNGHKSDDAILIVDIVLVDKARGRTKIGRLEKNERGCHFYDRQGVTKDFNEENFYKSIVVYLLPDRL